MTAPLPAWLEAFRRRLGAEVVETHISWLLLAGDTAWKLKKPVTLPFLDYGTPALRRHFCTEELRLNRRFAPGLYLGLDAVDGTGEWAVRMRRFPESQRLDHVCARGELGPAQLVGRQGLAGGRRVGGGELGRDVGPHAPRAEAGGGAGAVDAGFAARTGGG